MQKKNLYRRERGRKPALTVTDCGGWMNEWKCDIIFIFDI